MTLHMRETRLMMSNAFSQYHTCRFIDTSWRPYELLSRWPVNLSSYSLGHVNKK
jgi:hypothetical protein